MIFLLCLIFVMLFLSVGEIVLSGDDSFYAFGNDFNATLFKSDMNNFTTVHPCYVPNTGAPDGVSPGVPSYTGPLGEMVDSCKMVWVTPGRSVRDNCLDALGDQATPFQAYLAAFYYKQTVSGLYEYLFGCTTLISWPESTLPDVYVEQPRSIDTYLSSDQAYGSFYPTTSIKTWVEAGHYFSTQLKMTNMLDENSRSFIVYFITRNLNKDGLYYTLLKMTFSISIEGDTTVNLETTFSPMIDYSYGLNNNEWVSESSIALTLLIHICND
jgi:hypothetical protein